MADAGCPESCKLAAATKLKGAAVWPDVVFLCGGEELLPRSCWGCACHRMACMSTSRPVPPLPIAAILWLYRGDGFLGVVYHLSGDETGVREPRKQPPVQPAAKEELRVPESVPAASR